MRKERRRSSEYNNKEIERRLNIILREEREVVDDEWKKIREAITSEPYVVRNF